ncbi:MAG: HAD-IC family P-type ATPase, partial [Parvibaculum sp.]
LGEPELIDREGIDKAALSLAASLASTSKHPLSRAMARAGANTALGAWPLTDIVETPGFGLEAKLDGEIIRLGNRVWVDASDNTAPTGPELWLKHGSAAPVHFRFADQTRPDALQAIPALQKRFRVILLSGDTPEAAAQVANELGITDWTGAATPGDKIARINQETEAGHTVLMVGDGLNDAPALKAAHVSISPASAADISQTAADFVFQGRALSPVVDAIDTGLQARRLVMQNFGLAIGYNLLAVPLAMAGFVTPLIAAIAMSSSSLIVTGNALRLSLRGRKH